MNGTIQTSPIAVETIATERLIGRPTGARFGTLVHNVLRDVSLDAGVDEIAGLAKLHGRVTGAPALEVAAACEAVRQVLGHDILQRARVAAEVHREWPLRVALAGGVFEGIVDLAFVENDVWHVVDFKTDAYDPSRKRRYENQLRWYVVALERITGKRVQGYLLSA